jgi:ABC-type antimicrobial peptide transport system permease subunit
VALAEFDRSLPPLESPSTATPTARPRRINTGASYRFLDIMVRIESPAVLPSVLSAVQRVDPRMQTKAQFVDEIYAEQHAGVLLATRVIGAFGIVAFITAMAGLYGVMSFLVASRTREIGIRMALGATAPDITRMVFASSGVLVIAGALLGVVSAAWASKWIEAQLYGVSPTDPVTYIVVSLSAVATATVATWRPARQAARVDPAVTLRAE